MEDNIFCTVVKLETITDWNRNEKNDVRKFLIISQKPLEKENSYSFIEKFITSPRKFSYPKPTGEMTEDIETLEIINDSFPWREENLGKLGCEIPMTIFQEEDKTLFFSVEHPSVLVWRFSSELLKEKFEDFNGLMVIKKEIEITNDARF
jgi:hypothetical protein